MEFFEEIKKSAEKDIPYTIAYYGPSTASYEHVFPNWGEILRYVLKDKLEEMVGGYEKAYWNVQTMNLGLTGATSRDLLERFEGLVLSKKPDMIILFIGKNDAYFGVDQEESKENARRMIEMALERNIKVIFATSAPTLRIDLNQVIAPYVEADRQVAEFFRSETNFLFLDLFSLFPQEAIGKSYTFISETNEVVGVTEGEIDPLHYNRYGNAVVAKIILKEVFEIDFDEKKFLRDIKLDQIKYPQY